jgi:hypothetical protein
MSKRTCIAAALLAALAVGCQIPRPVGPVVKSATVRGGELVVEQCELVRVRRKLELRGCAITTLSLERPGSGPCPTAARRSAP